MPGITGVVFDLIARDNASPTFSRVGDSAVLAATKIGKATTEVERMGIRMNAVGAKLTKSFTVPIVAAAAVAVDQAAKYQSALNTIAVATGQNAQQMAAASKGLESIAISTGTSLEQLTTSLYTVEKGGLRGSKALDTVRASAEGAKAEGADLGTATQALTSIMASYGKSLGSPVQAENALIRGAGLAKTSYQDFAASLSNVVPIASSLHISFGQVAGAIDTMTQHGETAERATDNLSNLITNLAGQNTVASSAMQQLGINTINLQKNLGTRGLTGTLAILDQAMKAHTKNGMIVSSASKDAALATKSLDTEMGTFTGSLQTQSKALLSGKEGILDYQNYAKSLGGTAGAGALQFLALYKSSQGFSDQLKAGNGTIRTSATTLQKMLGGVTGMRTALMLGGTSAQRFTQDTSAVALAAQKAGSNVLGWSATQQTFNVKMDQAKEALQVLAVEAGTELLPALSKIAIAGEKAIGWVSGLDTSQKEVLGWGLGILAAAGPVLSLGGRLITVGAGISRFTVGATRSFATMAGATDEQAAVISTAAGRISTAIGAAGIGVAVGELTKNSSTTVKSIGVLGSALSGAAIGSAGGPWGAAIGAAAGAVADLGTDWLSSGDNAKTASAMAQAAAESQRRSVEGLYQSLQSVNGAYGEQYKKQLSAQLVQSGAIRDAQMVGGINPHDVLESSLGNNKATNRIYARLNSASFNSPKTSQAALKAGNNLANMLRNEGSAAGSAETKYQMLIQTEGKGILTAAQLAKGVGNLKNETANYGTSLDQSTAYGARNAQVIGANAQALAKNVTQQLAAGKGVDQVTSYYETQSKALLTNATQIGFNQGKVEGLIQKFAKVPTSVQTAMYVQSQNALTQISTLQTRIDNIKQGNVPGLNADSSKGQAVIQGLQTKINALKGKVVTATVAAPLGPLQRLQSALDAIPRNVVTNVEVKRSDANQFASFNPPKAHATGGSVTDGYFTAGERGWELGRKRGSTVDFFSHASSMAMTGMPHVLPGFADGTHVSGSKNGTNVTVNATVDLPSGITKSGSNYLYGGTRYDSKTAAVNARTRAYKDASYTIGGQSYTSMTKAVAGISDAFAKAARQAKGLGNAAQSGGSSLKSAFGDLMDSAKTAGLDSQQRARLTALDNQAAKDANRRLAAATKVAALRQARAALVSTDRSAFTGGFTLASAGTTNGVTSAVSLGSILAQGKQAALIAEKMQKGLIRLRKEGLALGEVQQLAAGGLSSYPQVEALLKATPKQLAQINGYESKISSAGVRVGSYVGREKYGDRGEKNSPIGKALAEQVKEAKLLREELKKEREDLVHFLEQPMTVNIHIDGKKAQTQLATAQRKNARRK